MEKTRIASVNGKYATDIKGRRLEIISNLNVFPGSLVFTDSKYIYGYDLTDDGYSYLGGKPKEFLPLFIHNRDFEKDFCFVYAEGKTGWEPSESYVYGFRNNDSNDFIWWYSHPYQFNAGSTAYAIRGSYATGKLYNAKGEVVKNIANRTFLTYDKALGLCWQKGSICQTFDAVAGQNALVKNIDYTSERIGSHWKYTYSIGSLQHYYDSSIEIQIAVSNQGAADISNLRIVHGKKLNEEEEIPLASIVQQMVQDAKNRIQLKNIEILLDNNHLEEDAYPYGLPDVDIYSYCLGTNTTVLDEYGRQYYDELGVLPVDNDAAQGAVPGLDLNQLAEDATGEYFYNLYQNDARVVHRLRTLPDGSVEFYMNLRGCYLCYGYWTDLNPDAGDEYVPVPTANAWKWESGNVDSGSFRAGYDGSLDFWYKVTMTGGSTSIACVKDMWDFLGDTRYFADDYVFVQTALDDGTLYHKGNVIGKWSWVKDVIPVGNNMAVVFGIGIDEHGYSENHMYKVYKNGAVVFAQALDWSYHDGTEHNYIDGYPMNYSYTLASDLTVFAANFNACRNIPYYSIDV